MKYTKQYLYELSTGNTPKREKEIQKYKRTQKIAEMKEAKRFLKKAFKEMKVLAKKGFFTATLITDGLSRGAFYTLKNTLENMGFKVNNTSNDLLYVSWENLVK